MRVRIERLETVSPRRGGRLPVEFAFCLRVGRAALLIHVVDADVTDSLAGGSDVFMPWLRGTEELCRERQPFVQPHWRVVDDVVDADRFVSQGVDGCG